MFDLCPLQLNSDLLNELQTQIRKKELNGLKLKYSCLQILNPLTCMRFFFFKLAQDFIFSVWGGLHIIISESYGVFIKIMNISAWKYC